jgi:pimeloyl-ACP methyl ester carboxylesterase
MSIEPFRIEIPQADLDDLQARVARTRFTDPAPANEAGSYGVSSDWVQRLVAYWRDGYDWRAWEARLNAYPQFTTEPDAFPLILTHGWPGSVVEFLDLIGPLTDPRAHGGDPADAFHLVIPSLPGFGFSGPTKQAGWNLQRVGAAWATLMERLGYERYGAHGNDTGSMVSPELGRLAPDRVAGVHVSQVFSFPSGDPSEFENLSEDDARQLARLQWFMDNKSAYNQLHAQQPQTVAHAIADSPAGLLAWNGQILTDDPTTGITLDDDYVLTHISIAWFTNTAGSSARLVYESAHTAPPQEPTTVPLGLAGFAGDFSGVRPLAERDHANIVQWNQYAELGGHYAAHLEPELLRDDIRGFFRKLR